VTETSTGRPGQPAYRIIARDGAASAATWRLLPGGDTTFGGSLSCDVAMSGAIDPELILFGPAGRDGGYRVTALAEGLMLEGRPLAVGEPIVLGRQAIIDTAAHTIEFSLPAIADAPASAAFGSAGSVAALRRRAAPALRKGNVHSGARVLLAASGFFLCAGLASLGLRSFLDTGYSPAVQQEIAAVAPLSQERLKAVLTGVDLAHLLAVRESGGQYTLTGELTEDQAATLQAALMGYGGQVVKNIRFKPGAGHGVAGYFLSPRRLAILSDGALVAEGAMLRSGWRVTAITADGVKMDKGGRELILTAGPLANVDRAASTGSIRAAFAADPGALPASVATPLRGALRAE
jgi:hypothetical protein